MNSCQESKKLKYYFPQKEKSLHFYKIVAVVFEQFAENYQLYPEPIEDCPGADFKKSDWIWAKSQQVSDSFILVIIWCL